MSKGETRDVIDKIYGSPDELKEKLKMAAAIVKPIKMAAVSEMKNKSGICYLITFGMKNTQQDFYFTLLANKGCDISGEESEEVDMTPLDSLRQESHDRIRERICYYHSDCFILCFSISNRSSFENVEEQWFPLIKYKRFAKRKAIILVGTQKEQREDKSKENLVSLEEGNQLAKKIKASKYIECSTLMKDGLEDIFTEAINSVIKEQTLTTRMKRWCTLS